MTERQVLDATDRLVEDGRRRWGRLATRPAVVNPLDADSGVPRALRRLRLKEWAGWTLVHPEAWSSMIIQDAHYLASAESYVYDAATGALREYAATGLGGSARLPAALYGSRVQFGRRGLRVGYDLREEGGLHRIRIEAPASGDTPALSGDLELDGANATAPLSVSSPLPGGAMYTHKAVFPASGELRVGDRVYRFDPDRDLAILDEHHTFLPYRTTWLWGTFAQRTPDGIVGANFARRPTVPGSEEESCLWLPGAAEPLADVTFTPRSSAPLTPWHVASADGRLDVTFEPVGRKAVKHQLLAASIDYFQLYGTYTGTVGGREVRGVHGVCESMRTRS
ncbi:DUF2804 domain-containing protein [Actinomadura logoneensis]|uniref:DUF2804 domain-containing protein n=1 Tax=Actinomadura logoneensis TaxID=2293572 RepID=A0A372JAA6_9ACTN|nr:DUF2804 domain-containing protein [Actinomadura logoneensis]RFU36951.1 DUF2804 domain-containing protein [Actinomadura logoneensis]